MQRMRELASILTIVRENEEPTTRRMARVALLFGGQTLIDSISNHRGEEKVARMEWGHDFLLRPRRAATAGAFLEESAAIIIDGHWCFTEFRPRAGLGDKP